VSGSGGTIKGNKIYVIDALTGALVRSFDTARSVIADTTLVVDNHKKALYGYTADMAGNVYRLSFGSGGTATWNITPIASLGCNTPSICTDAVANRKFGFAPSVVTADGITYHIMLGSGEREKPVSYYAAAHSVTNYFFAIKDKPADSSWLTSQFAACGGHLICKASLTFIAADDQSPASVSDKGWYLGLAAGEQVVTSALTIFGTVSFSTHQPADRVGHACSAHLGRSWVYNISYTNAEPLNSSRSDNVAGNGLPPSPVGGRLSLDDGSVVNFCMGCSGKGGFAPAERTAPSGGRSFKSRLYWYIGK
jgi:type IV pilus assembly protein PilY1